jgi:hypothetical protein
MKEISIICYSLAENEIFTQVFQCFTKYISVSMKTRDNFIVAVVHDCWLTLPEIAAGRNVSPIEWSGSQTVQS